MLEGGAIQLTSTGAKYEKPPVDRGLGVKIRLADVHETNLHSGQAEDSRNGDVACTSAP